ncbi:hypothetical protein CRUP_029451 [Coryphaenoides rupestris]|nr:hypothetical protein CRUP_029451 [Coryphaenoides rupestris]
MNVQIGASDSPPNLSPQGPLAAGSGPPATDHGTSHLDFYLDDGTYCGGDRYHLSEHRRREERSLVAQAYTSISAQDFAAFVGYSVEEAVKGVVSQGWLADPNTRMVMPQKPDPPPVSLVPNEQQLARLTDYVAFLEN